jgi:hypothetical protein
VTPVWKAIGITLGVEPSSYKSKASKQLQWLEKRPLHLLEFVVRKKKTKAFAGRQGNSWSHRAGYCT